jgi:uncharacterized Zn-binding protein involved in type VI secretion
MPAQPVSRIGDAAGGLIVSGMPTVLAGGIPVARIGDAISPHGQGVHAGSLIVTGSATVYAGGIPVARIGDSASCGHLIMTGQVNVLAGP